MNRVAWLPLLALVTASAVAHADLASSLVQEVKNPDPSRWQSVSQKLAGYHVVFGQLAEQEKDGVVAFADHIRTLEGDLKSDTPSMVTTSLYAPYETNADLLKGELTKIYEDNGRRPLILFGNPGVGPEFLYTAMKYPELVQSGVIGKIVLLTPVFGLPFLADRSLAVKAADSCAKILDPICEEINKVLNGKISKLDPKGSRAIFEDLIRASAKTVTDAEGKPTQTLAQKLAKMVYYVRVGVKSYIYTPTGFTQWAHVPKQILPYFVINHHLDTKKPTDGMTYSEDQLLRDDSQIDTSATDDSAAPVFGTDLTAGGQLNLSHWDLFVANYTHTPAALRAAFTRAVFAEILGAN